MLVVIQHLQGARLIPANALRGAMVDGPEIVICKDGTAQIRSMQVGVYNDKEVEVLGGIDDTDWIAVDHVLGLKNDTPIRQLP